MLDETLTITQADVADWTSLRPDRIALPYQVTDDLLYHAYMLILDAVPYYGSEDDEDTIAAWDAECVRTLDASTVTATLKILPYRRKPLAGIALTVDTADGQHLTRQITGKAEPETIENITAEFFGRGAAGLCERFRSYWSRAFSEYIKRKTA